MKKSLGLLLSSLVLAGSLLVSCETTDALTKVTSGLVGAGILDEKSGNSFNRTFDSLDKATEDITPEMSYYIGRTVASSVLAKYKIRKSKNMTEYLNSICSALALNSDVPYPYKGYWVTILDTDEINAMATPGGHIFISKGLINCTDSEDALAAVIAHELSHIQLQHSITVIKASRGTEVGSNLVDTALVVTGRADDSSKEIEVLLKVRDATADAILYKGFSQEQEFDADANALILMNNTGYDPSAMLDMLELIKNDSNGEDGGWKKTHPKPEERIKKVNNELKKIKFTGSIKAVRQERFNKAKKSL